MLRQRVMKRDKLRRQQEQYELDYRRAVAQEQYLADKAARDNIEREAVDVPYDPPVNLDQIYTATRAAARLAVVCYLFELAELGPLKKSQLIKRGLDPAALVKDKIVTKYQDSRTGLWCYKVNLPKELDVGRSK